MCVWHEGVGGERGCYCRSTDLLSTALLRLVAKRGAEPGLGIDVKCALRRGHEAAVHLFVRVVVEKERQSGFNLPHHISPTRNEAKDPALEVLINRLVVAKEDEAANRGGGNGHRRRRGL